MAIPTRFSKQELARIDRVRLLLGAPSRSSVIRQSVLEKVEEVETTGILEVRDMTPEEAKRLIGRYLRDHPGIHYVSELVERLGIEPRVAFQAAQELIDEGRARLGGAECRRCSEARETRSWGSESCTSRGR